MISLGNDCKERDIDVKGSRWRMIPNGGTFSAARWGASKR